MNDKIRSNIASNVEMVGIALALPFILAGLIIVGPIALLSRKIHDHTYNGYSKWDEKEMEYYVVCETCGQRSKSDGN